MSKKKFEGKYSDFPGAVWVDKEREIKGIVDKTISEFRSDLEKWVGSDHYKTGEIEWIDLVASHGELMRFAAYSIGKYAIRIPRTKDKEKIKKDLLKIGHYAGMLYGGI